MKKVLLGFVCLAPLVLTSTVQAADKKVVVATAGDIKPFSYEDKAGELTGYDIEVIKAASKYLDGYKVTYKRTSWKSIFVGLDSGHYQIAANNLSYTKERADKYLYSLPIAKNPFVLVVPKDSEIKSLEDIGGKTTQDDTGTSAIQFVLDWNKEHPDNPSKIEYSGEDLSKHLLELENGEFDYMIFDKISVETVIKQKGFDLTIIPIETNLNSNNYIIFSDDSNDLQKQFNKAVKKLYKNGKLEKLSQKYLGGSYLPDKKELD